ncbi:MAG: hypothetical protein HY360_02510 [Verrucomicrobia bacterium]|nr:hypothetical protein [Verrucomicrobiota bacterium]
MATIKARVGDRLCLCGNVDCGLLLTGTPSQIHAVTAELLAMCKTGGGLVLGASNAVQPVAPNVFASESHGTHFYMFHKLLRIPGF